MDSIIQLPRSIEAEPGLRPGAAVFAPKSAVKKPRTKPIIKAWNFLFGTIWLVTALAWPLLKWVLSIEAFFQLVRALYHWNTQGVHAGWTFLLHFSLLTTLTCFVAFYKPKWL